MIIQPKKISVFAETFDTNQGIRLATTAHVESSQV